ncbi:uncharacterized protein LOC129731192 [Wyeomyia smithii]|uniref:uncharacterized protein LOC129731192 n=1 Tax=Wyeomyia smithii TaxID=174621 RepID=UPI002467C4E8|nr:uncharacterized protein LOC129731192 [Wyeomyia smithii]
MESTSAAPKQRNNKRNNKSKDEPAKKPKSYEYDSRNLGRPVFGVIVQWDAKKTYTKRALNEMLKSKLSAGQFVVPVPVKQHEKSSLKRKQMPYFRRTGPNKGMIMFKTMEEANEFAKREDPDYYSFIPLSFVVVVGVAVMPASLFNLPSFKSPNNPYEILQWRKQKLADKKIRVTVAIRGTVLPPKLTIRETEVPLEPYKRQPVHCSRCLRYGHRKNDCLQKPRCGMCIETKPALKHFENKCLMRKRKTFKCYYCRENHATGAPKCSEHEQQCKYKTQLTENDMDYVTLLENEIIPAIQSTSINSSRVWLDSL